MQRPLPIEKREFKNGEGMQIKLEENVGSLLHTALPVFYKRIPLLDKMSWGEMGSVTAGSSGIFGDVEAVGGRFCCQH